MSHPTDEKGARDPQSGLVLACYDGAYGPTVRIDTLSREELIAIRDLFRRLASGELRVETFSAAIPCRSESIHSLVLRRVESRSAKALTLHHSTAQGPAFHWSNTDEGWVEQAEKVDRLVEVCEPGHQYLTTEGIDDALVELCYLE